MWSALAAKDERKFFLSAPATAGLAAFATAAVAWLAFFRPPVVEESAPAPVIAQEPRPETEPIRVTPIGEATWQLVQDELSPSITLEAGEIEIELAEAISVEVVTPETRVRMVGGRARVTRHEDGTEVSMKKGSADLWAKRSATPVTLGQHQSVVIPKHAARAAQAPIEKRAAKNMRMDADDPRPDPTTQTEQLEEARKVITTDAPRAASIAEKILSESPSPELEAAALAVLADAERRSGLHQQAAQSYAKLRDHPRGANYAEEAMLQRALLLARTNALAAAREELDRLAKTYPDGVTAPERAALKAKIHLTENDPRAAARAILEARITGRSRVLENRRREVARALETIDPELAKILMKGSPSSGNTRSEDQGSEDLK